MNPRFILVDSGHGLCHLPFGPAAIASSFGVLFTAPFLGAAIGYGSGACSPTGLSVSNAEGLST